MQTLQKKNTNQVLLIKQGGEFNTNIKSKVKIVLPELDEIKSLMFNFYVNVPQQHHRYYMVLGCYILDSVQYIFPGLIAGDI